MTAFAAGFVQAELAEVEVQRQTGLTEEQWRATTVPYVKQLLASGDYPYLERVIAEAEDFPDPDSVFERRLGRILGGLALSLESRTSTISESAGRRTQNSATPPTLEHRRGS